MKEFYERKLEIQRQEFGQSVSTLQYKISDLTASLASESDRSSRYRQELLSLKSNYNEELAALQQKIEEVADESDRLKRTTITQMQSEVSFLQTESETLKLTRAKDIDVLKREQQIVLTDLNVRLDNKESKLNALEFELAETKKQLKDSNTRHEDEIQGFQDALKSTRHIMDTQEQDLKRLKLAREDARKDARELAKEVATLELDMKRVRKEKGVIEAEAQKLERMIYGKGNRKVVSPRTKH
jgi:chromosome segregation ATPase